jgi:hypothetical protein
MELRMQTINNVSAEKNNSTPMDEYVLMVVCSAILAYFIGDWLFSYIDQNFISVVCKAKYYAAPLK